MIEVGECSEKGQVARARQDSSRTEPPLGVWLVSPELHFLSTLTLQEVVQKYRANASCGDLLRDD